MVCTWQSRRLGCLRHYTTIMDFERMRQIEELFHEALACDPEDRSTFLAAACGTDPELLSTVESLLVFDGASWRLRTFVGDAAAHLIASLVSQEVTQEPELRLSTDTIAPSRTETEKPEVLPDSSSRTDAELRRNGARSAPAS